LCLAVPFHFAASSIAFVVDTVNAVAAAPSFGAAATGDFTVDLTLVTSPLLLSLLSLLSLLLSLLSLLPAVSNRYCSSSKMGGIMIHFPARCV
jgi:hypothetical protein